MCMVLKATSIEGVQKWHHLQDRLDVKKEAEKSYSPTEKIMLNLLYDRDEVEKKNHFWFWETDMYLTPKQKERYTVHGFYFDSTMNALADPWPNGVVKYRFSSSESVKDRTVVVQAMENWSSRIPCIKFQEDKHSKESSVLLIVQRDQAFATLGYRKERTQHLLSVSEITQTKPVVTHLLGHVLGLPHSHSRPDRDRFLHWMRENVELVDVMYLNQRQDCPYDLASVMHYDMFAFTANRNGEMSFKLVIDDWTTNPQIKKLVQKEKYGPYLLYYPIGQWKAPTVSDIVRVENGYGCKPTKSCLVPGYDYEDITKIPLEAAITDWSSAIFIQEEGEEGLQTFNPNYLKADFAFDVLYTYIPDGSNEEPCDRLMMVVQPAQRPTIDLLSYFLLTGCTFMQFEVYDTHWDQHYVYCAADFARMYRKVIFLSAKAEMYLRIHRMNHPLVRSMKDGVVKSFSYTDYICTGQAVVDPPCQGVADPAGTDANAS